MGLSNLLSNLPILITVVLLIISVVMFFYFRQKISELEKASVSQAKVLHSFISQSLAMPRNYNTHMQLSSNMPESEMISLSNNSQQQNGYVFNEPKEKIVVSDDDDDEDEDEYDETSSEDDSSSDSDDDEVETVKKIKIQEIDVDNSSDVIEYLDTSKVKKIFLNSDNNNDSSLVPFNIQNDDGSCASSKSDDEISNAGNDSLSELSDNEDDDRVSDNYLSNSINVTKFSENKPIESMLNELTNNNLFIVKKPTSLNSSLKEKEEGSELKALKVDTLRQIVIDKSLVNVEEAKKLKKKDLVELLAQVEKNENV